MEKQVLIVGASSSIGKNVLEQLPSGWNVKATYCTSFDFSSFCKKFPDVTPICLDLKDPKSISELSKKFSSFDIIIYIAANSDPKKSIIDPSNDLMVNANGVIGLLENVSCKRFIYISSGAVYLDNKFPYVISKLAGEQYVSWYAKTKGFEYVVLRLFEAFGPYSPVRKIFRKVAEAISKGEKYITLYGDGTNLVDPLYISETARGIIAATQGKKSNVTIDLCTGNPISINEVVMKIANIFKAKVNLKHQGEPVEKVFFKGNPKPMKDF